MLKKIVFVVIIISNCLILNSCQRTADEHYNSAIGYAKSNDFNSAISELDKAIEINPNFSKAYLERGKFQFNIQPQKAISDFSKVIELDSNLRKEALTGRGHAYIIMKEYKKAVSDFEELQIKNPFDKKVLGDIIGLKMLLKDTLDAKKLLDERIVKYPSDAESYYGRALYRLTSFNDTDGGCEDLRKAIKLYNDKENYFAKDLKEEIEKLININCSK